MKRKDFRFLERLRVRWAEIDAQKIVFNGHYLMYFDTAVAGYWRALALPYAQTMASLGGDLYVRKATVEYHGSARYDDLIDVGLRCARIGNTSLTFSAAVFRGGRIARRGRTGLRLCEPGHADPAARAAGTARRAAGLRGRGSMIDVRIGGWAELGRDAQALRSAVFVAEQKIPAALEWDAADANCVHALARNRLGLALATGRMLEHAPGVARIGRMAVDQNLRGSGVGRAVLDALLQAARERGYCEVVLHAQTSAAEFYRRAGFVERGPEFDEAGIAHIEMGRAL